MEHAAAPRRWVGFCVGLCEQPLFVIGGYVLTVLGLGLTVTTIALRIGLSIGLLGLAMFVGGLVARMDQP